MYAVDERDRVVMVGDLPQSSPGAPCPVIVQDEGYTVVAYYVNAPEPDWSAEPDRIIVEASGEPVALVRFSGVRATMFGPPNDEAFAGHPLAARGLERYCAAEVQDSSWIRILERMSSVHPRHRPEAFAELRHFVLAFHDSTFECVARGYEHRLTHGLTDRLAEPMFAFVRERGSPERST